MKIRPEAEESQMSRETQENGRQQPGVEEARGGLEERLAAARLRAGVDVERAAGNEVWLVATSF